VSSAHGGGNAAAVGQHCHSCAVDTGLGDRARNRPRNRARDPGYRAVDARGMRYRSVCQTSEDDALDATTNPTEPEMLLLGVFLGMAVGAVVAGLVAITPPVFGLCLNVVRAMISR